MISMAALISWQWVARSSYFILHYKFSQTISKIIHNMKLTGFAANENGCKTGSFSWNTSIDWATIMSLLG